MTLTSLAYEVDWPNFDYAFSSTPAAPLVPVALPPPAGQASTKKASHIVFGSCPKRPKPEHVDNFGNVFSLQGTNVGMIAQRRRLRAEEARKDVGRAKHAKKRSRNYLRKHAEAIRWMCVDYEAAPATRGAKEDEAWSPFSRAESDVAIPKTGSPHDRVVRCGLDPMKMQVAEMVPLISYVLLAVFLVILLLGRILMLASL